MWKQKSGFSDRSEVFTKNSGKVWSIREILWSIRGAGENESWVLKSQSSMYRSEMLPHQSRTPAIINILQKMPLSSKVKYKTSSETNRKISWQNNQTRRLNASNNSRKEYVNDNIMRLSTLPNLSLASPLASYTKK